MRSKEKKNRNFMNAFERMKELVAILTEAAREYYQGESEIMSNERYDALYDELLALEKETGLTLSGSPTEKVGFEVLSALPKEKHKTPALSLDKTKETETLQAFLKDQKGVLSWKLDGLTIVLTYEGGRLRKAVTRGNGEVGEVITENAKCFRNLPLRIPYQGTLVLRGEAVIKYADFEKMNQELSEDAKYKNPRNLCSGSVRQLDARVTAERNVNLIAFALIEAEGVDFHNSFGAQLDFLDSLGFETVPRVFVTEDTVADAVKNYAELVKTYEIPSDGLVLIYDDIAYGLSLGRTAKFPRNAIAFKWRDEKAETILRDVEWNASRTGLINPVAVFDPVELEGTTVKRASVHNVSIVREMKLGIGDTITVYKANMIIPQISENLTKSGNLKIPAYCPSCGRETEIRNNDSVQVLFCNDPECPAKAIQGFSLFVSRNGFNVEGLSEATMEKFIDRGFVRTFGDLFRLEKYKDEIVGMEGMGEKSYRNLMAAIDKAREIPLSRFLFSIGIPGIGAANGKILAKAFAGDLSRLREAAPEELVLIDQIGDVMAKDIAGFFRDEKKSAMLDDLLSEIHIREEAAETGSALSGKSFVITGDVMKFRNRNELKDFIEQNGGSVRSSVSAKTDYLINNNVNSNSSKNKTAKELGIPILSEEEFLELVKGGADV